MFEVQTNTIHVYNIQVITTHYIDVLRPQLFMVKGDKPMYRN